MNGTSSRPSMLIARAVHELWRERMLQDGWRCGESFNTILRTHEALVPFDELPEDVRRDAEFDAIASGVLEQLVNRDPHPRGEGAMLLPSTAHAGQRVTFVDDPSDEGIVIGCSVDPQHSWPELIHVRWDDGAESSHPLAAGELRVAGPQSGPP